MIEPRVLVVDHHDSYTWNLVHLIAAVTGQVPVVREHEDVDSVAGFTHVVLSPGPGSPSNRADFALQRWVFEQGLPVLGVCLGMQGMVTAFGGEVAAIDPAHGQVARIAHDGTGVFVDIPQSFEAVRYHSLAAVSVPDDLVVNATTDGVVMGVRHRALPLHGVQFHPESILTQHGAGLVANFLAGA